MTDYAYIDCSGDSADFDNPVNHSSYRYAVISCTEGDVFSINGSGGVSSKLWAFTDASKTFLAKSSDSLTTDGFLILIAPEDAAYLVINDKSNGVSYVGSVINYRVNAIEEAIRRNMSSASFWEQGGIVRTTGAEAANSARIRTPLIYNTVDRINCSPVVKYIIFVYDPNTDKYLGVWNKSEIQSAAYWFTSSNSYHGNILGAYKIRIMAAYTKDTLSINPTAYKNVVINTCTDYTMSQYGKAADAGTCGYMISNAANNNSNMVTISHRGTRMTRPDSTSIAYIHAKECGYTYAEGDIQRTQDGFYVIGHDNSIYDRTGVEGNISDMTLAELKAIDFGGYLFPEYAGQAILTLEEFLQLCNNLGMKPVLDFKTKTEEQVAEILEIIDNYGVEIYNVNGTLQTLKYILAEKPNQFVRRSYADYSSTVNTEIASLFADYPNAHFMVAYDRGYNTWTDEVLLGLRAQGIELMAYEINSAAAYEQLMSAGRYYVHNFMGGSDFNPIKYALHRDNNVLISVT